MNDVKRWMAALAAGLVTVLLACNPPPHNLGSTDSGSPDSGTPDSGNPQQDAGGNSVLLGTWDVTITQTGSAPTQEVVTVGQDALTVTLTDGTFMVQRSGSTLLFNDVTGNTINVSAVETAAAFSAGIVPFQLGGSWNIAGGSPQDNCTAQIVPGEITSSCANATPYANMTLQQTGTAIGSIWGDFGGTWSWTWNFQPGTIACTLQFTDADAGITQVCSSDGGSALDGLTTFSLNGNVVSGTAPGGAEFSATRQ